MDVPGHGAHTVGAEGPGSGAEPVFERVLLETEGGDVGGQFAAEASEAKLMQRFTI